jgi:uncharacterized Zn ribbon protein
MKNSMKALIALSIGLAGACISFAGSRAQMDGFSMRDGRMFITERGDTTELMDDMKLRNGTEVLKDGTVITKDGNRFVLHDGDSLEFDGTLVKAREGAPHS